MTAGERQARLNAVYERLTAAARNKRCAACKGRVWVAWSGDTWSTRCPEGWDPRTERQPHYVEERMAEIVRQADPRVGDMMDPGKLVEYERPLAPQPTMSVEQFKERQELIKYVVSEMKDGVHYGIIPGTKDRSLWEPGAEYLRAAFNIQWGYDIIEEREDLETGDCFYRFRVYQILVSGHRVGGWEASAWSKERKFWCRGGQNGCAKQCDQEHPPSMERQMLPHNVRDRALKRGFVAMIRNVTGTTGYFKGDLEGGGVEQPASSGRPTAAAPVDANTHPWLVNCPEHNVAWFQTGKMREPAHRDGEGWCNMSKVLKPHLDEALAQICADSWSRDEVNAWLKAEYEGKTWSALSPAQKLEAIDGLKSFPPPSAEGEGGSGDLESQFEDVP